MSQFTNAALRLCSAVAVATALVLVSMPDAGAQSSGTSASWKVPRTPWGHPDFQGVWTSTDLDATRANAANPETPQLIANLTGRGAGAPGGPGGAPGGAGAGPGRGATGPGDEAAGPDARPFPLSPPLHWAEISQRVMYQVPPMTPLGRERASNPRLGSGTGQEGNFAGPEELGNWVRCISRGFPDVMTPNLYNNNYQIVQSSDSFVVMAEMIHDARVIPISAKPHAPDTIRQWLGDSRAHWEGDTLVVEVTNIIDRTAFRGSTEKLRVVERYTRTGPNTLRYDATLEDPAAWTAPWSFTVTFTRDPGHDRVFEYACHEGNYGMRNILTGSRATDAPSAR